MIRSETVGSQSYGSMRTPACTRRMWTQPYRPDVVSRFQHHFICSPWSKMFQIISLASLYGVNISTSWCFSSDLCDTAARPSAVLALPGHTLAPLTFLQRRRTNPSLLAGHLASVLQGKVPVITNLLLPKR